MRDSALILKLSECLVNVPPQAQLPWLPSQPPTLPEPTRPRRWSERRIKATLGNAIVGFVLGVLAAPVWGMLSFLVLAMLGALLGFGPLHSDDIIYATPIAMLIGWFALSVGARGTCSKSPVAPVGVALGLGAGLFRPGSHPAP
jgi:hypothetical protein